jgi:nitrogen regulatory protein PII
MLDDVIFALHALDDFPGAAISEVQQIGSGNRHAPTHADRSPYHAFPKSVRIEVVCPADRVDEIVGAVHKNAHTGLPDDGDIYVSSVERAIRLSDEG